MQLSKHRLCITGNTDFELVNGKHGHDGRTGCLPGQSWALARETCEAGGARLCTAAELADDETRGTGCGADNKWAWSSDECHASGVMGAYGHRVVMGST